MKISRIEALVSLCNHAYYRALLAKVSFPDLIDFCIANSTLGHQEFERKVQGRFVGKPKPKHWTTSEDILVAANNIAFKGVK